MILTASTTGLISESAPSTANFAVIFPIVILANLIIVFLTIFLILKLKNNLGVYICWIPSAVSLLVMLIFLFWDVETAFFILLLFFLPYFLSYMITAIIKIRSGKLKAEKEQHEKEQHDKIQEELKKISIQDL